MRGPPNSTPSGFSLVEMALVLLILGLMLGGLMEPLKVSREVAVAAERDVLLVEAEEALFGFALVNGRLPCADSDGDGFEEYPCPATRVAWLPWRDLGLRRGGRDPWGGALRYGVSGGFAERIELTSNGTLKVCEEAACTTRLATDLPAVILTTGPRAEAASAEERENLDDDTTFVLRPPSAAFDDHLRWLPTNRLLNRLVAAGVVP
ncbi:prepilin-type N-terminal cleavage/methylation domain-containing protein [Endothiovibrio diazotrophicus]